MIQNILRVKCLLFSLMVFGASVSVVSQGYAAGDTYRMRIAVFSDSMLAGDRLLKEETFCARLQRRLQNVGYDVEILNFTKSDDTTLNALARVETILRAKPDLVLVALGLNDIERGIDPTLIYNNLYKITYSFMKTVSGQDGDVYTLLVGVKAPANREYSYRTQVENNFKAISDQLAVSLHPSALEGVMDVAGLSMADGVHPNADGVNVVVENLLPMIDSLLRYRLHGLAKRNAETQRRMDY